MNGVLTPFKPVKTYIYHLIRAESEIIELALLLKIKSMCSQILNLQL